VVALEKTIADLCQEVFGAESVGLDENFFDLGANSLLMIRMHQRLEAVLGMTIPIVHLFQHPTVRSLAQSIKAKETTVAPYQQLNGPPNLCRPALPSLPEQHERVSKQRVAHEQLRDRLGRRREQ
jgi:acyl carrier protein